MDQRDSGIGKFAVTEDDKKFLRQAKQVFESANDFRQGVTIVDDKWIDEKKNDQIKVLLGAIDKVMKAKTATEKHEFESEALNDLKEGLTGRCSEKCREFLMHFSNLRKHFFDVTKQSLQLHTRAEGWME